MAHQGTEVSFPTALRIAAGYMVLIGVTGLVWPLLHLGPNHPEFQARSLAYRVGAQSRELVISAGYLVAGIGLFWRCAWARKLALGLLVVATIYSASAFAWGFAGGPPTPGIYLLSGIVVAVWNGVWFYLVYRPASRVALS